MYHLLTCIMLLAKIIYNMSIHVFIEEKKQLYILYPLKFILHWHSSERKLHTLYLFYIVRISFWQYVRPSTRSSMFSIHDGFSFCILYLIVQLLQIGWDKID